MELPTTDHDRAAALAAAAALWRCRLAAGWTPPPGSAFPWAQVRLSLDALLPGMTSPPPPLGSEGEPGGEVALIVAGNTPLIAWPPLCAALLAGAQRVRVKMSRDETLWPRLFVEALAEVAPAVASRVELLDFPGEDRRTAELCRASDAVVAYGSDETITALRAATPAGTPFFGFGHAISVGLAGKGDQDGTASGFARDVLTFDQQGCLSPQVIFTPSAADAEALGEALPPALERTAVSLEVPPVTDPGTAAAIRRARDMALFAGFKVVGDPSLRWTVAHCQMPVDVPEPVGHGFVYVIPLCAGGGVEEVVSRFGWARGRVSCVGVAGAIPDRLRAALMREGVSRICGPGEMQTPPLDWPNGGVDLFSDLWRVIGDGGTTPGSR